MKKNVFRAVSILVISLYMVFFFPKHLSVILDYFSLKEKTGVVFSEINSLANNLVPAKEVDKIIKNSGAKVSFSTISDSNDISNIKQYDGSDLKSSKSRIVEYTVTVKDNNNSHLFGYLSSYSLSYSSMSVNENGEIVLRIFCN